MIHAGILTGNLGHRRAGVANYIYHLVSHLKSNLNITTIGHHGSIQFPQVENLVPYYPLIPYNTLLWSFGVALQKINLKKLDFVHNPAQFPLPKPCHSRYVVTIHDITAIIMPEYHTRYRTLYSRWFLPTNIMRASHIITDSVATKEDIIDFFPILDELISVIPLAADRQFKPCTKDEIQRLKVAYSLQRPFILFVGTIEPRKNLPNLLKAFHILIKHHPEYELVVAGFNGWNYSEVYRIVEQLSLTRKIRFLTYVPHEDLPALYCAAALFVLPSWYEGFGLPPLEAMQCGVPVIVSDRGSLPEIVGPGGCMVSPDDPLAITEAMIVYLTDNEKRKEQIQYNLDRAKLFSWDRCAEQTQMVYRKIME